MRRLTITLCGIRRLAELIETIQVACARTSETYFRMPDRSLYRR